MEKIRYTLEVEPRVNDIVEMLKGSEPVFVPIVFPATRATLEGAEPKLICNIFNQIVHRIVAKKEILTVEELKGKTLMVNTFGGTSEIGAKFILKEHGDNPEVDLKIIEAGQGLEIAQLEALKRGYVDAIAASPPYWYLAENAGFHTLGYAGEKYPRWGGVVLTTNAPLIRKSPKHVEGVVKALVKTERYIHNNKEATIKVILEHMNYADTETAATLYDQLREAWTPQLNIQDVRNLLRCIAKRTK